LSSSPAAPASVEQSSTLARPTFFALLEEVADPRHRRGVRHRLAAILAVGLAAVIAGSRSFAAIGEWVADLDPGVLRDLGAGARGPSEATIRRAFTALDGDRLDVLIGAWMRTRVGLLAGRHVIAIDGKTVRGAKAAGGTAPHLVAALDHTAGVVLGQVQVALKSNEIPALRTLLDAFDLVNRVVTADAMHTQTATATYIVNRGGHYVFTVKANQPGLYRRCKALPWTRIRATSSVDRTHGRRVRRTIKVAAAPQILDVPHAVQVAQLRRTRTINAKKSVEVVYIITSMAPRDASPTQIARWVQGHWGIENRLHWVRDVVFDEDRSTVRTANSPRVMATLRSTAISLIRLTGTNNIAKATRHHARHAARPAKLLLTC
jgi:predicted transposase YbfD/YdcC